MLKKTILIFFILKNNIKSTIGHLKKVGVNQNNIFIYDIANNNMENLISISINEKNISNLSDIKHIKLMRVHKKNGCLFSINALNRYIVETNNDKEIGNISFKDISVDWELLKDKLLLLKNNELYINNLKKVEFEFEIKQ